MGSYDPYYKNYYNSIKAPKRKEIHLIKKEDIIKKIIFQLSGTLVLVLILIICKVSTLDIANKLYKLSKENINISLDYKKVLSKIESVDIKEIPDIVINKIKSIKDINQGVDVINENSQVEFIKINYILPLNGEITSPYGLRESPIDKSQENHEGIDISCPINTDVAACYKGTIKDVGEDENFGKYIVIDHGNGIVSKYGHLNSFLIDKDVVVEKGDIIGKSGATGKVTGPHLHFALFINDKSVNPEEYINIKE